MHNQLYGLNRAYYTQEIKYQGRELLLHTDWFHSVGVKETVDKKLEILVPLPPNYVALLKTIEDLAINGGLNLPADFYSNAPNENIFRRTPALPRLYIKLHHEASFFDKNCRSINLKDLGRGDFRVVIHVKGLYIGHHPSGKLVSLQLRVMQLQNIPKSQPCMFKVASSFNLCDNQKFNNFTVPPVPNVAPVVPETPQPGVEVPTLTKKSRKPRLQRQNAVISQQHQPQQSLPSDFFTDLDLSTLGAN